jgi:hypothetical protein
MLDKRMNDNKVKICEDATNLAAEEDRGRKREKERRVI